MSKSKTPNEPCEDQFHIPYFAERARRNEMHKDWIPQVGEAVEIMSDFESLADRTFVYYHGYILSEQAETYSVFDIINCKVINGWKRREIVPSKLLGGNAAEGRIWYIPNHCVVTMNISNNSAIVSAEDMPFEALPILKNVLYFMYLAYHGKVFYHNEEDENSNEETEKE